MVVILASVHCWWLRLTGGAAGPGAVGGTNSDLGSLLAGMTEGGMK